MKETLKLIKKIDKHTSDQLVSVKSKVTKEEADASAETKRKRDKIMDMIESRLLKIDVIDKPMYRLLKNRAVQMALTQWVVRHINAVDTNLAPLFGRIFFEGLFTYRLFTAWYCTRRT